MRKLKARFCARGYEQIEGVNYCEDLRSCSQLDHCQVPTYDVHPIGS
jgi:hypothetical protein